MLSASRRGTNLRGGGRRLRNNNYAGASRASALSGSCAERPILAAPFSNWRLLMKKRLLLLGGAIVALLLPVSAQADELKFFQGTTTYTGAFSGLGSVYQQIDTQTTNCPGTPCTSDVTGNPLTFTANGTTSHVTMTSTGINSIGAPFVWDDTSPNFGGLGVGVTTLDSNDQINGTNVLHLHFASAVTITGLATLFDPAHADEGGGGFDGFAPGAINGNNTFLFSQNGTSFFSVKFGDANTLVNVTGQDFYFEQAANQPDFYVSGLTYSVGASVNPQCTANCASAVPGPVVGAGLPGLITACLTLIGLARRRRNKVVS